MSSASTSERNVTAEFPVPENRRVLREAVNEAGSLPSVIGRDVALVGSFHAQGEVQFQGRLEGELSAEKLTIGRTAEVSGILTADEVVVHGKVKGVIQAKTVHLSDSASVCCEILHQEIQIAPGALVEGRFRHLSEGSAHRKRASFVINILSKLAPRHSFRGHTARWSYFMLPMRR